MSQLLENTYSAYEAFLEGELNQYDLMSLIEEGIISGEVLESMLVESGLVSNEDEEEELEEGFMSNVKKYAAPAIVGGSLLVAPHIGNKYANSPYAQNLIQKHQVVKQQPVSKKAVYKEFMKEPIKNGLYKAGEASAHLVSKVGDGIHNAVKDVITTNSPKFDDIKNFIKRKMSH